MNFDEVRIQFKQTTINCLLEDHLALAMQMNYVVDDGIKMKLKRKIKHLGKEIRQEQKQLAHLQAQANIKGLMTDYKAASIQFGSELSEVNRNRLKRQIEILEQQIIAAEAELSQEGPSSEPEKPY